MTVYQILIHDEEGQTHAGDIYWNQERAETAADKLAHDTGYEYCSIVVVPRVIKE